MTPRYEPESERVTDTEKALIALACTWDGSLIPEEAELDSLFDEGWLRTERDFTDEYLTVLTPSGWENVAARIRFALSKLEDEPAPVHREEGEGNG